jgi:hypothetical protein
MEAETAEASSTNNRYAPPMPGLKPDSRRRGTTWTNGLPGPEKARMRAGAVRRRSATCQRMEPGASALLRTDVVFFAEAAPLLSLVASGAKVNCLTAAVRPRLRSHALLGFWFIFSLNGLGKIMGGIWALCNMCITEKVSYAPV